MTYIIFILSCIAILFVYWKLKWFLAKLWIILFCVAVLGLVITPLNLSGGIITTVIAVSLMVVLFFVGLISTFVSVVVVGPILTIYYLVKSLFIK